MSARRKAQLRLQRASPWRLALRLRRAAGRALRRALAFRPGGKHWLTSALLIISIVMGSTALPANPMQAQQPEEQVIARIRADSSQDAEKLHQRGLDLLELREGDYLFAAMTRRQLQNLRAEGWDISVDTERTLHIAQPDIQTYRSGYHTRTELYQLLYQAQQEHPQLAEVDVYGASWEKLNLSPPAGHDLLAITLTNRLIPGPKPTFFLMASIHAREITTSELAWRFVDHLLSNYVLDGDITWLLDHQRIVVVPLANPDGRLLVEQGYVEQRKNTNKSQGSCSNVPLGGNQFGVDLNRNSSFRWNTIGTSPQPCHLNYAGSGPASEPEIQALQALIGALFADQRGPLDGDAAPITTTGTLISLHAFGDMVLWSWASTADDAPNAAGLTRIGRKLAGYNGTQDTRAGQPPEVLYPASGTTDDWAYGELGIAAYTFEIGPGSGACSGFTPPYSCLDGGSGGSFWPKNLPALLYAARIARAPYQLAEGPTIESLDLDTLQRDTFQLTALADEQRNGNHSIAEVEYTIDTPPWDPGASLQTLTAVDGNFDSAQEQATGAVRIPAGRHIVYVRARDSLGNWGPPRAIFMTTLGDLVRLPLLSGP